MAAIKDKQRGTWSVKYYQKDAITGKSKQVFKRGFKTKREALAWEASQKASETVTEITFRDLDNLYIQYKNPRKESTAYMERMRVDKYVTFADMPVSKITKQVLMDWYLNFISLDLSVATKNYVIMVIRSALKFGADFYGIQNNSTVLKKLKRDSKRFEYSTWTPEEFNQFIQCVDSIPCKYAFTFMYCTGVRRGEALALRGEDIDLEKGTAHIHHQIKSVNIGFEPLKTESSERTIKLPQNIIILLRSLKTAPDEFIFGIDRPIPLTNLHLAFRKGIEKANVKRIRIHDLRHSFATNAINNGCNIVAVSKYLGHATIQQTLETYTHLLEKTDDQMVNTMSDVLSVILP